MSILKPYRQILLIFILCSVTGLATAQDAWNDATATAWLNKKEWKNGLKPEVSASVNKVEFARQYHKNQAAWDKAFAFLRDSDLTKIKSGKYAIDGTNVYANITEGPAKEFDASAWESHHKYIDLHYVIKGQETIGAAPVSKATVTKAYNDATDNANYNAEGQYYVATPAAFFLFFPADAHRPNIKIAGYDVVKKLVIKIKVAD